MTKIQHKLVVSAFATLFMALLGAGSAVAQNNNTQSPFTRFGIGTVHKPSTHATKGMGAVGLSVRDASLINPLNPASYTAADSMTFIFDFGLDLGASILQEGSKHFAMMQGNISYLSILFPFNKYVAFSAGLKPYSSVGYKYVVTSPVNNAPQSTYLTSFLGVGNISSVYAGLSVQPIKEWSIGLNGEFLFGTLTHQRSVAFDETLPDAYNPAFSDKLRLQAGSLTAGTQVELPLGKESDRTLVIGATYSPRLPMVSKQMRYNTIKRTGAEPVVILSDTVTSRNSYYTADSYGLGLGFKQGDKWFIGADFLYNRWGNSFLATNDEYAGADQWQVALGMSLTPDSRSRSYGKRVQYRWGLTMENSPIKIKNTATGALAGFYRAGASFGVGLPLVDRRSYVDLALSYTRDIPTGAITLADNRIELSVALRFNEAWFKKIRIE